MKKDKPTIDVQPFVDILNSTLPNTPEGDRIREFNNSNVKPKRFVMKNGEFVKDDEVS